MFRPAACALILATAALLRPAGAPAQSGTLPRLKVSENHRFLVTEDGRPFFWLGDTAWELFHRATREDAERYLRNRADQRFTVIQAVALAEFDGLTCRTRTASTPLRRQRSDAARRALLRARGLDRRESQRARPVRRVPADLGRQVEQEVGRRARRSSRPQTPQRYGEWLGPALQGRRPHLDPRRRSAGRDRSAQRAIIRAMARGLRAGDGGAHLITFHPPAATDRRSGSTTTTGSTSTCGRTAMPPEFTGRYDQTRGRLRPHAGQAGASTASRSTRITRSRSTRRSSATRSPSDVRRPLYWDLFGGAFGHTYGHHSVWQMWTPEREPINNPLMPWTEAIDQPGAAQMQHGRALLESRPFLTRVPDRRVIVTDACRPACRAPAATGSSATRDTDGSYAMVYAPVGRPFSVRMSAIAGPQVKAWWFNPRDGTRDAHRHVPEHGRARVHAARSGRDAGLGARARRRVEEVPGAGHGAR